jgi:hypothetical protein
VPDALQARAAPISRGRSRLGFRRLAELDRAGAVDLSGLSNKRCVVALVADSAFSTIQTYAPAFPRRGRRFLGGDKSVQVCGANTDLGGCDACAESNDWGSGALVCLVAGASVALATSASKTPAGGPIQLFVTPGQNQGNGKILITGAVGDYGSSSPTESSGDKKIGVATLQKGTIKIAARRRASAT